jgi:signal peptidase II
LNRKKIFSLLALLFIIVCDMTTKEQAKEYLQSSQTADLDYPYGGYGIFQGFLGFIDLSLGYVENQGAAFGILSQHPMILMGIRIAVIALLLFSLVTKNRSFNHALPLILITGGAVGNIIDMVRYHYVIDFINIHFDRFSFPLFNIADASISCGAAYLIITEIVSHRFKKNKVTN